MFETEGEIIQAVKDRESDLSNLRARMEDDFDIITLKAYEAEIKGREEYTSSAPRNFFDNVIDGVNRAPMTLQVRVPSDAKEKDRRAASQSELFLYGALDAIDRRHRKRSQPSLKKGMAFFVCSRGWLALRALVQVPAGETETVFDVMYWDPLQITWEVGTTGLLWAAYKRMATRSQIEAEYNLEISGKQGTITDFWSPDSNSVLVNSEFVKEPTEHGIGHVPVLVLPVGSMPAILTTADGQEDSLEFQGESLFAASRQLVTPRNKYISRLMDIQKRSVSGTLLHKSKDGTKQIEFDPYIGEREIRIAEDEEIEPLLLPQAPPETAAIMGVIEHDWLESTKHGPLAYGGVTAAESGTALAIRNESTRAVFAPRTELIAEGYTWLCEELLHQFATRKEVKPATLSGYDREGEFFKVTIKPGAVDPNARIEVRIEPKLPRDEQAEMMMALQLTARRNPEDIPMISKRTARGDILKLRDPDAEEDRVLVELGRNNPAIRARRIAAALERTGETELANEVMELFQGGIGEVTTGPQGQPAPPQGPPPGMPQQGPPQQGSPQGAPEIPRELAEAILNVLVNAGRRDIAQAFAQTVERGMPLQPKFLMILVQALEEVGAQELIQALLTILGVIQPAGMPGTPQGR